MGRGRTSSRLVKELMDLLSIPNVAADRAEHPAQRRAPAEDAGARGFAAELLETAGNPLVYGELRVPGRDAHAAALRHYDGQPVDPKGWKQPDPFTPVLRTGRVDRGGEIVADARPITKFETDWRIYARSASDDKSPIVALLAALDALKAPGFAPTSNIRVILDGEEEASSPSLVPAIAKYRDKLHADLMVILDGPMHSERTADDRVRRARHRDARPHRLRPAAPACTAATTATGCRTRRSGSRRCWRR